MSDFQQKTGLRWNGEINAGHMLVALGLAVGGLSFLYANQGDARLTQQRQLTFESNVAARDAENKASMGVALSRIEALIAGVQKDLRDIPALSANVALMDRQLRDGETRDAAQDQRLNSQDQRLSRVEADVEGLKRGSGIPLPGRPR